MSQTTALPHVLAIDDDEQYLHLLDRALTREGLRVSVAASGEQGILVAESESPDVILLDIVMPGMGGYEVCRRLKQNPCAREIPVLFMTALGADPEHVAEAFRTGASGYVLKPVSRVEIVSRVRAIIRQRYEAAVLQRLGQLDEVTGLPSRRYFSSRLDEELSDGARYDAPVTVVMARLSGVENVRATGGEDAVARVLRRFAALLRSEARRHDLVARWDDARLAMLLPRLPCGAGTTTAKRVLDLWALAGAPTADTEARTTADFGVATHTPDNGGATARDLIERAEQALEQASWSDGVGVAPVPCGVV